jgi:hypothetical protein
VNGRASRRKGHDYERVVARVLREVFGDGVRRGLQSRSGEETPDVEVPVFWIECKRGRRTDLKGALAQARAACPEGRWPLAICKDDHQPDVVAMHLDDFLALVRKWWEAKR